MRPIFSGDSMRFASLHYAKSLEDIPMGLITRRLPEKLRQKIVWNKNPIQIKETAINKAEGYEITLPLLASEGENFPIAAERILEKTVEVLKQKDVAILVLSEKMLPPSGIRLADGRAIFGFLIGEAVKKAAKLAQIDLKNAEILLIDGGNFLTSLTLDGIYPEVNFLSIFTDRVENYQEKTEKIFEDTGLNVQLFSSGKNYYLKNADIVINCASDQENFDYFYKSGAVYLDVNQNTQKLKRIMSKRQDMIFADGLKVKWDNGFYDGQALEACLYVTRDDFRQVLSGSYAKSQGDFVRKAMLKEGIQISCLTCLKKAVKTGK